MRWIVVCIGCLAGMVSLAQAQRYSKTDRKLLSYYNDTLGKLGGQMLDALTPPERLRYDSMFTVNLVKALQVPFSFDYPFDSILTAPILYPEDKRFRIITWHYEKDMGSYRQKGAIQYNTPDGKLKLLPLFDASDFDEAATDSVRSHTNWVGAIYYNLITRQVNGKPVYFLFGYDANNDMTTRKWIEPMQMDEAGQVQFGGDFFNIGNDSIFPKSARRYLLEYKKDGNAKLNYDRELDLIVMDNLVSETNEPEKRYTLVPGGDYEALKWENNRWSYISRLFVDNLGDGNEPKPMPILDDLGNANEAELGRQSEKNKGKEGGSTPPTPAPVKKKKKE